MEMKINSINIRTNGYITCKSVFYFVEDLIRDSDLYTFKWGECEKDVFDSLIEKYMAS